MSSNLVTPLMLQRELTSLLERNLFADTTQALQQTAAEYSVPYSGILVRAFYGDDHLSALVPSRDLNKSLDYVSDTYLKPAVQRFLFKV